MACGRDYCRLQVQLIIKGECIMFRQVTLRTAQAVHGFITNCLSNDCGYDIEYLKSISINDEEIIDNDDFTLIIDRRKDGAFDVSVELFAAINS